MSEDPEETGEMLDFADWIKLDIAVDSRATDVMKGKKAKDRSAAVHPPAVVPGS